MSKLLSHLKPSKGATRPRKRLGRGDASGHGGTASKGHKGQKARSGGYHKVGFEGGQMPLARRLPKRGFNNHKFKTVYATVNLSDLNGIPEGTLVDLQYLKENKRIKKVNNGLKVLGDGGLEAPLKISAHKFSKSALEKIKKTGGEALLIESNSPQKNK